MASSFVTFYVGRIERKPTQEEKQEYLDTTVTKSLRDEVREAYNSKHPDLEPLV